MAEGPEEAQGRPPGQDDDGRDREPGLSPRGAPAAAPSPRDAPQAEPQAPGRPPSPALAPASPEGSEPPREPKRRREAVPGSLAGPQELAGCGAPEAAAPRDRPARLSAREYSRQVHEWLWQSYCGYLTWHSGLAALPAYCSPQPPAPPAAAPLAYYNPFYFLSAGATPPAPAAGLASPAPVAGLGPRAAHVQGSARATSVTRGGAAAPARPAGETERQAGERRGSDRRSGRSCGLLPAGGSWRGAGLCTLVGGSPRASAVACPGLKFPKCMVRQCSSLL